MTIYFDNAATTFPKPKLVQEAVIRTIESGSVNAGRGVYSLALEADKIIHDTRLWVAKLLNYQKGHTIFAPSATLALNQVLLGMPWKPGEIIYITPFEHNSVARIIEFIRENYFVEVIQIPVDKELNFQLDELEKLFLNKPPKAVIMAHGSNVCGLITPLDKIARLAKEYEAVVIIDGAQVGPLLPVQEAYELIDFYIFSGHKTFYGPFGIAGFVTNGRVKCSPIIFGGTGSHSELLTMPEEIPFAFEVGSSNIIAIAGLHAACRWIDEIKPAAIVKHEQELLFRLVTGLSEFEEVKMYLNSNIQCHLGTLSITVEDYTAQEVGMILSQEFDIAVRTGLHCAPMAHRFLGTMPYGTVRVGLGYFNSKDEVDILIKAISQIV